MFKKIFTFVAILLMLGGLAFAGSTEKFGQGGYPSDPHRIYRYVHNATASNLTAGQIVVWDLDMDNGVSVTTTTESSDSTVAGILVEAITAQSTSDNTAAQDIGLANWGFMQTYGFNDEVDVDSVVNIAGSGMGTSTTAGEAAMFSPDTGHARNNGFAGFFYDTAAADAEDVECFLVLD